MLPEESYSEENLSQYLTILLSVLRSGRSATENLLLRPFVA